MSSIPIWGVSILVTGAVFIIGCLLFGFIRYRHFAHSSTNRIEYSDNNRGVYPFDTKSTISMPPPGTSQKDQNLYRTVNQEKSTSTIQSSTVRHFKSPRRWLAKKKNVRQLFDLSAVDSNISFTDSATSLSPPPLPPKDNTLSLPASAPAPFIKDNTKLESSSNHKKKSEIALPSPTFHREDSSMQASPASEGISSKGVIEMESGSRQLLEYDLESMFAWSFVDDTNTTKDEYDYQLQHQHPLQHQHRHSIGSILQNNNSLDTESITSGSVHHLVRDSTVLDVDHRSLTARSITNSIRSRLYDMTSWWPIQDKIIDHLSIPRENSIPTAVNIFDATSPLSSIGIYAQDPTHLLSQSNSISKYTSSCRPSLSSASSTYSHHGTLNQSKCTDQNHQKQNPAPKSPTESEEATIELSRKYSISDNKLSPSMFPTFYLELASQSPAPPPLSLKSVSLNKVEFKPTIATKARSDMSAVPIPIHNKLAPEGQETTTRSAMAAPTTTPSAAPIWSSHKSNSNIIGGDGSIKIDRVHRELQAAWNTHRLSSNQDSIASTSIKSSGSQEMSSPPDSVHPRQLNQHLAPKSLQSHHRPSLPNRFMTGELLVQGAHIRDDSLHPTVSFSSSTVRTMIPENEPIESYIDNQKAPVSIQHQHHHYEIQNHTKSALYPKHEIIGSGTSKSGMNKYNHDDRREPRFVGTRIVYRQQRGSIPWSDNGLTKVVVNNNKTPAQCERDRYLQSLNK